MKRRLAKLLVVGALIAVGGVVVATPAHAWPEGCSVYQGSHYLEVRASCTGGYGWVRVGADCVRVKAGQIEEWTVYGEWVYVEHLGSVSSARCAGAHRPPQAWYEVEDDPL